MTPMQAELHEARKARLARFAQAALPRRLLPVPPEPLCLEPEPLRQPEPVIEPSPEPEPELRPQRSWFWITGEKRYPRIEIIQRVVAHHYQLRRDDIVSARRTANVVRPRQVAFYLSRRLTLKSLPEIGRRFGGRDHTTIIHGCRKIEELAAHDGKLAADIAALESLLQPAGICEAE